MLANPIYMKRNISRQCRIENRRPPGQARGLAGSRLVRMIAFGVRTGLACGPIQPCVTLAAALSHSATASAPGSG
ncbi:hypothetical protein CHELA40_50680 [Chelatococcus asaccharovorans]|nr:hypothetical protein CHELA17_20648 [Chelatococcus asaccharovorans]CAH1693856.1 hypothetical protein CHELA40_50680 [Chelatococcus asaccharovorans]